MDGRSRYALELESKMNTESSPMVRSFVYLISSVFNEKEGMVLAYREGRHEDISVYVAQIRSADIVGYYTIEQIALSLLKGEAFDSSWCNDGIVTAFFEVSNEEADSINV
jgi:hypothetical protein